MTLVKKKIKLIGHLRRMTGLKLIVLKHIQYAEGSQSLPVNPPLQDS